MPTVLVTGASRGIGRATAERLAAAGWDVHAGVRRPDAAPPGTTPVLLDVTDEAQVAALPDVLPARLDAVVNNAGVVVAGPVEGLELEGLRRQLEVNVVGQVAVTQAVLPLIREAGGRVVFMSSISGRLSGPFLGAYTASKHAIEALGDALRMELRPWGIAVVLVEPGTIDTDIWRLADRTGQETADALAPPQRALYDGHIAGMRKFVARAQRTTSPVDKVAATVEKALTAERPRARYLVGPDARAQAALLKVLPTRAIDAATARIAGVPRRA